MSSQIQSIGSEVSRSIDLIQKEKINTIKDFELHLTKATNQCKIDKTIEN